MRMRARVVFWAWLAASCGGKQGTFSSDIGVDGVALEEGSLAGTWLGQFQVGSVVDVPVVGPRYGGSSSGRLVKLRWDAGSGTYAAETTWCWAEVFEVEGLQHAFDDAGIARLRQGTATITADHAHGAVNFSRVLDLWGVRDLPDPYDTPLPTHDDYTQAPQSSWVFDEDGDGHPGFTDHMSGTVEGDAYVLVRTIFAPHGVARSPDELVGLVAPERLEQRILDSTSSLWAVQQDALETRQSPDPDPRQSWFQVVRAGEGATCDDVRAARADGRLAAVRPF